MPLCELCVDKWFPDDKRPCFFCKNYFLSVSFFKNQHQCDMCKKSHSWEYYKRMDMCDKCKEADHKMRKPLNIITCKPGCMPDPNFECCYCKKKFIVRELVEHHKKRNCPKKKCKLVPECDNICSREEDFDWRTCGKSSKSSKSSSSSSKKDCTKEEVCINNSKIQELRSSIINISQKNITLDNRIDELLESNNNILTNLDELKEETNALETKVDSSVINCDEVAKCLKDMDVKFNNTDHNKITVKDLIADNIVSKNSIIYCDPIKKRNKKKTH